MKSLIFITAFIALAATVAISQASQSVADAPKKSPLGLMVDAQISRSLHEGDDIDRSLESQILVIPSLQLSEMLKISARLALSQNLVHEKETTLKNTRLGLSHQALRLNPFLSLAPSIGVSLPTDTILPRQDSFLTAVSASSKLSTDFTRLGLDRLNLVLGLAATKNFHEYRTNRLGSSNTSHSLVASFDAFLKIISLLSLSIYGERALGLTYEGSPKNNFELTETANFTLNRNATLSIGHSNSGAAYRENGTDSRVSLFNPNDSTVFGGMTLIF